MSVDDQDIALIHQYLSHELSDEEAIAFEKRLEESASLKAELAFQRKVLGHIQAEEKARLKVEMLEDFRQFKSESKSKKPAGRSIPLRLVLGMAATLLLISVFYFVVDKGNTSKDVFQEYYQAYDGAVIIRGEEDAFTEGLMAYNAGDYQKALGLLLKEDSATASLAQRYLLIANSYLSLDQPEKAIEWLDKIPATSSSNLIYNQQWYLAMAYLLLDKPDEAKNLLTDIAASTSIYASQAEELLEESLFN